VKKRKRGSIRLFQFFVAVFFFFLSAGISYVWLNFKRTQIGYELSQLKKQVLQIEEYNRKLKLEVAFLKSPQFLENKGVKEFGLRHPVPQQIVFLP